MLSFLSGIVSGILGLLGSFLPDSPFQDWVGSTAALQTGLGWLNWVFPVGDCIVILAAVLAALVVWVGVRMLVDYGLGTVEGLV